MDFSFFFFFFFVTGFSLPLSLSTLFSTVLVSTCPWLIYDAWSHKGLSFSRIYLLEVQGKLKELSTKLLILEIKENNIANSREIRSLEILIIVTSFLRFNANAVDSYSIYYIKYSFPSSIARVL